MKAILTSCYLRLLSFTMILSFFHKIVGCIRTGIFTAISATRDAENLKPYIFNPNDYGLHEPAKVACNFRMPPYIASPKSD